MDLSSLPSATARLFCVKECLKSEASEIHKECMISCQTKVVTRMLLPPQSMQNGNG